MNRKTITMVTCPYCEQEWITEHQLTCQICDPKFKADMVIADLMDSIESLNTFDNLNKNRIKFLDEAITKLCLLKNKFENV